MFIRGKIMINSSIEIVVDLGEFGERNGTAFYKYSPGRKGRQYMPNGDPGYPDEPPEIEVTCILVDGISIPRYWWNNDQFLDTVYDIISSAEDE